MFFIFDYLSNSSKPSDCCRKISFHKMASVHELKNELSSVVNSTVSNLKRNRTETMLDKEPLKRRSHKRTTYPGQKKIGGSILVYNDVGDKVRATKVKTVQNQHKQTSVARWVWSKVHELSKKSSCFEKISSCINKFLKQLKLLTIIIDFKEFYFKLMLLK